MKGITPACAGKTYGFTRVRRLHGDHPRVCGENFLSFSEFTVYIGSPPRVRGKRPNFPYNEFNMRITPACAGKTTAVFFFNIASQDHPRVCGENMSLNPSSAARRGSPPRVRGKRNEITQPQRDDRITPAHAGKTHRNKRNVALKKDHPRACGENTLKQGFGENVIGSPPRMRGKPVRQGKSRR